MFCKHSSNYFSSFFYLLGVESGLVFLFNRPAFYGVEHRVFVGLKPYVGDRYALSCFLL